MMRGNSCLAQIWTHRLSIKTIGRMVKLLWDPSPQALGTMHAFVSVAGAVLPVETNVTHQLLFQNNQHIWSAVFSLCPSLSDATCNSSVLKIQFYQYYCPRMQVSHLIWCVAKARGNIGWVRFIQTWCALVSSMVPSWENSELLLLIHNFHPMFWFYKCFRTSWRCNSTECFPTL